MFKKIILFGAGATVPETPPLGKDLYKQLVKYYPSSWGNFTSDIKQEFDIGFENGMAIIWEKYSQIVPLLMRHLAIYFAQFCPSVGNLYIEFFKRLKSQNLVNEILYSTLNYELILELAISFCDLRISYFGNHSEKTIAVCKLHGSCNFIPDGIQATRGVTYTNGVIFDTEIEYRNPNDVIQFCLSDTSLYPAMCIYTDSKPIQIGRTRILEYQKQWGNLILDAERILIIGVRPYSSDTHIWNPLAETDALVGFVGSETEFKNWRNKYRKNKPSKFLGSKWNDVFELTLQFLEE